MPDSEDIPDEELSALFWKGFIARNQSIIVDLMYGQLKSTVRCLECGNISITFDPMNVLQLPITRPSMFTAALVPYDIYRKQEGDSDEEDPDYKTDSKLVITEHLVF